jgi:DNA (cytosine-5)-methyltransferase 1
MIKSKYSVIDLFCGCGGLSSGFIEAGFDVVLGIDHWKEAIETFGNTHKNSKGLVADLFKETPEEISLKTGINKIDLIIGGPPCQGFSIAGKRIIDDERNILYKSFVDFVKFYEPSVFLMENVANIVSMGQGIVKDTIIKDFQNLGYKVVCQVLNASEFGVPQKRERVFILGFRDLKDYLSFSFPQTSTLNGAKIALKHVIDKKANKDEKWFFSQRAVDGMLRVREKMNKGRVQDLNQPCNTISSHLAKVSLNALDPVLMVNERYRRLTPREASSIQSFPESFKLDIVSENRQYKAIGNAVPPVLMWHIANALANIL